MASVGPAVAGAWSIEAGQHVGGSLLQGPSESAQLGQSGGDAVREGVDDGLQRRMTPMTVKVAINGDQPLVDAPGRLHLDVPGVGEQCA